MCSSARGRRRNTNNGPPSLPFKGSKGQQEIHTLQVQALQADPGWDPHPPAAALPLPTGTGARQHSTPQGAQACSWGARTSPIEPSRLAMVSKAGDKCPTAPIENPNHRLSAARPHTCRRSRRTEGGSPRRSYW